MATGITIGASMIVALAVAGLLLAYALIAAERSLRNQQDGPYKRNEDEKKALDRIGLTWLRWPGSGGGA